MVNIRYLPFTDIDAGILDIGDCVGDDAHVDVVTTKTRTCCLPFHSESCSSKDGHPEEYVHNWSNHGTSNEVLIYRYTYMYLIIHLKQIFTLTVRP